MGRKTKNDSSTRNTPTPANAKKYVYCCCVTAAESIAADVVDEIDLNVDVSVDARSDVPASMSTVADDFEEAPAPPWYFFQSDRTVVAAGSLSVAGLAVSQPLKEEDDAGGGGWVDIPRG